MQMIGTSLLSPLLAHSLSMASVIMSGGLFKFLSRALWRRRDGSEIHFILHFFFVYYMVYTVFINHARLRRIPNVHLVQI